MAEDGREFTELRHEVIEARNQAIKTDNQVKNLTLDIRAFDKRFDSLEARVRVAGLGVVAGVALTIVGAAYMVSTVRIKRCQGDIAALNGQLKDEKAQAQALADAQQKKVAELEGESLRHARASALATQVLAALEAEHDADAGVMLDKLQLNDLTPLERRGLERPFIALRQRQAQMALRLARDAVARRDTPEAVAQLRRAVALDAEGRAALPARYQLGNLLWAGKRYDEAAPVLRALAGQGPNTRLTEEAQYMLATSLAHLGQADSARPLLARMAAVDGRFAPASRAYLAALEAGTELPVDLAVGRVRTARRPAAADAQLAEPGRYTDPSAASNVAGAPADAP